MYSTGCTFPTSAPTVCSATHLAVCRRVDGALRFNFTYLDRVMDFYRSLNLRPFLELGFMPEALASGTQTVFTWKGNVTRPGNRRSGRGWCRPRCGT